MPHIHTNPGEHDATASAWIIRTDSPEPALFLHLHKKLGKWMQFGGHVELLETPWQAALHELAEESGYDQAQLQLRQPRLRLRNISDAALHPVAFADITHEFPGIDHKHTDRAYLFTTDQEPINLPGDGESTNVRWITASQFDDLPDSEILPNVREIGLFAFKLLSSQDWEDVSLSDFVS